MKSAATPQVPWKARNLYHDESRYFRAPGCATCIDRERCGGIHSESGLLDCSIHCCSDPAACKWVCRSNPHFRQQVQEIGGFSLTNVALKATPAPPQLPGLAIQIYHGSRRTEPFEAPCVAIKLSQLFDKRTGAPLFASRAELNRAFMIADTASLIVTGVDKDPVIERWWRIGRSARRRLIAHLVDMKVDLATTPNYTLSLNWPRTSDLFAMKRILLCAAEMMEGGLPTALHVNGRSPHDFERWGKVLLLNPAITHLAYEFTTGAAHGERRDQHIGWLCSLAASVGRPLHLVAFGDMRVVAPLKTAFAEVTWIDTSTFMKTINRRRATRISNNRLAWKSFQTPARSSLHELLAHNATENGAYFNMRTAA